MFFHDFFSWPPGKGDDQNHMLVPKPQPTNLSELDCRVLSCPRKLYIRLYSLRSSQNLKKIFRLVLKLLKIEMTNLSGRLFQIILAFSEYLNFTDLEAWLKCLARKKVARRVANVKLEEWILSSCLEMFNKVNAVLEFQAKFLNDPLFSMWCVSTVLTIDE